MGCLMSVLLGRGGSFEYLIVVRGVYDDKRRWW
jgi:hypothetical protein